MNDCVSTIYDIITVIISIADISTDIVVLLSFYYQERTTFFIISLVILCVAQCAYSAAFMWRYEVTSNLMDRYNSIPIALGFYFILLPIGPIIPVIIFLTDDENQCFQKWFQQITGFSPQNEITSYGKSKTAQWLIEKLNKHIGFIIEAGVEAFPQSLLQICAIVYYKEANYVSIVSILLSMISVMTKSLVFSKGLEIKTFIWTWFCVVVDFFGIFFTLSWVFYSNETILIGNFLGYFNFIAEIWIYKVFLSVIPCVLSMLIYWCCYYLWNIIYEIVKDDNCCYMMAITLFFVFCVTTAVILMLSVWLICLEVFCFTFIAFSVYVFVTKRWENFESEAVGEKIKFIIDFIGNTSKQYGKNDTIIRILAINYAIEYNKLNGHDITDFIDKVESNQGIKSLHKITYSDLRNNVRDTNKDRVKIFAAIWHSIKDNCGYALANACDDCDGFFKFLAFFICGCILFPIFLIAKIFQIVFPYFIIAYLYYENNGDHRLWHKIHLFQLVMLFAYIGLQFTLLILGILSFRVNYWLWHICPGHRLVRFPIILNKNVNKWYNRIQWYPKVEKVIMEEFGADIAQIILDYVQNIRLGEP